MLFKGMMPFRGIMPSWPGHRGGILITLKRQDAIMTGMGKTKRATVYLEPELHKALRVKAAETDTTLSDLVNEAVKRSLAEDAEDLAAFDERADEPYLAFEDVLEDLRRRGKL